MASDKSQSLEKAISKLLQIHVAKEAHRVSGRWDSSAQTLEKALKKHGIVLSHKLYHKYIFPDGMKNTEYYDLIEPLYLFYEIYSDTMFSRIDYEDFNQYLFDTVRDGIIYHRIDKRFNLSELFRFCICLALSDSETNKQEFKKTQDNILKKISKIAEKLRQLNPELQTVKYYKNFDFIMGVIYGFAPEEIDYFTKLQHTRNILIKKFGFDYMYQQEESNEVIQRLWQEKEIMADFFGFMPEYFLSPETSSEIIAAIAKLQTQNFQEFDAR